MLSTARSNGWNEVTLMAEARNAMSGSAPSNWFELQYGSQLPSSLTGLVNDLRNAFCSGNASQRDLTVNFFKSQAQGR